MDAPERPDPTMPCTGCGECCNEKICKFGVIAFPGATDHCPGLIWEKGRYWCSLIKKEAAGPGAKSTAEALGIGRGCYKNRNPRLYRPDVIKDIVNFIGSLT